MMHCKIAGLLMVKH